MAPNIGAFSKLVTTNTTASSLVVGGATGGATTGTGGIVSGPHVLASSVPAVTTNALYNDAGTLFWNGVAISGFGPAGATGDVQFNNAGAFGADTGVFTYTAGTDTLGVNNIASQINSALTIVSTPPASGNGTNITITAAAATAPSGTPTGGAITISGGAGVNGLNSPGGSVTIAGGVGGNPSGSVTIRGGHSSDTGAASGSVTIAGGSPSAGTSTTAGSVTIKSGDVQNNSGTVTITTGAYPDSYANPGTVITMKPSTPTTSDGVGAAVGAGVLIEGGPGQAHNNAPGNGTGGAGGTLIVRSGTGGDAIADGNTRTGGAGATLSLLGGAGGSATGSSGTRNGGNGGNVIVGSGAAGTGATANGTAGTITFNIGPTTATTIDASANMTHAFGLLLTGAISPTQLVANTNDWNPTGLSTAAVIRIDVSTAINLTGIVAQATGRMLLLYNKSADTVTLIHDATSTAANRFFCPNNIDFGLSPHETCWLRYDGTDTRWTVIGG